MSVPFEAGRSAWQSLQSYIQPKLFLHQPPDAASLDHRPTKEGVQERGTCVKQYYQELSTPPTHHLHRLKDRRKATLPAPILQQNHRQAQKAVFPSYEAHSQEVGYLVGLLLLDPLSHG